MSETKKIVIVGASFSGLGAAHYIARHTLPKLQQAKDAKYELHIVSPSTHFWFHNAAPREIVSVKEMPHEKAFVPIMDGFNQYPEFKNSIIFHHATATGLDSESRVLTITPHGSQEPTTLDYYALVIATGVRSPSTLTTLHGDHHITMKALDEANVKIATANDIIIGGGGPVGVETAGEIGAYLNGKARITLVAGGDKLLPILRKALAVKAQGMLEKVGVTVLYNTRVTGSSETADGKTEVQLSNGKSMTADIYIPAFGVSANTDFLPANLKTESGYVKSNPTSLRVDEAGPRVYAIGDVSAVDKGGILNMFNTIPIFGANFNHDVLGEAKVATIAEKKYTRKDSETQLVPVGPKTGVGAFNGFSMPGFAVKMIKGKDYMISSIGDFTEGKKWAKP